MGKKTSSFFLEFLRPVGYDMKLNQGILNG